MKKFVAIGLGNFGLSLAKTLVENGSEVLGIDISKEIVHQAKEFISHVIIGDASRKEVLDSLMLKDFDAAIVSIGQDMAPSILISLYLKEIGIPKIIVRAISEDHGKILEKIGVSDVIFPERDMAIRLASILTLKNAIDYLPIGKDYSIMEIYPPKSFMGKSLKDLQIASKYNCQIIGIRYLRNNSSDLDLFNKDVDIKIAPSADDIITDNSVMIIIGKSKDIERMQALH